MKGMKESNSEGVATHTGPESCVFTREGKRRSPVRARSVDRGTHRPGIELRKSIYRGGRRHATGGRQHEVMRTRRSNARLACPRSSAVLDPEHVWNHLARELGDLMFDCAPRWSVWSAMRIQVGARHR